MSWSEAPAVVLAAGEGRRLAPLTNTRPKPMLPVGNRPLLEHVLEALAGAGVSRVVLVVGYRQERIRNHFGDGGDWAVDVEYVEQTPQLGTGHAVLQARSAVDGPFLVLNGDRIVEPSIVEAVRSTAAETGDPAVAVTHAEHPSTFGVVDVSDGRLTAIEEKPLDPEPAELINAGVYGFDTGVFDAIEATELAHGEVALTATLNRLASEGTVRAVSYDDTWLDVTHLWDLPAVNANWLTHAAPSTHAGRVAERASVGEHVVLGDNAHVAPGATLRGGVSLGNHVVVGPSATLENAVVLSDATIGAGAVVRDAIVGANARVGPNVTVEGGEATVTVDDTVHHAVDLGGVLGDNATVGGGVVLAPGAIVGNDADVAPGTAIDGWIAPGAVVQRG